jgi:hypothetical protein
MVTLNLTDEQVIELVNQLPREQKARVLLTLVSDRWPQWASRAAESTQKARAAAQARGLDWDAMSEEQRERFVDELLHEAA